MINNETNKFSNKEIAHLLRSVAAVYLLTDENRFRITAYEKAADSADHLTREIRDIWQDGRLSEVPGIGSSIGSHLDEYFKTGKSKHFDSILKKVPNTVFVLMKIPTIGPKKAYKLVRALKLLDAATVVGDLKKACLAGKIARLETFGEKSQKDILEAISLYEQKFSKTDRMPLPYAFEIAKEIIKYLKKHPNVMRVDALGSLRRMTTTIGDVDIAIQVKSPNLAKASMGKKKLKVKNDYKNIIDYFIKYPKTIRIDNAGENKASIIVTSNIRVDLRVQEEKSYGSMLQYFTGSKGHNIKLREYGLKKGYSLNEYGIKPIKTISQFPISNKVPNSKSKLLEFEKEEKFYKFLGLQYIPPEIREGTNEIETAEIQKIPKLIETKDIKGDLHIHSSYDLKPSHDLGKNTYKEIIEKADQLGYQYVGFADHNPKIADLSEKEVIEIMKLRNYEIRNLLHNVKKVRFFIGLEVDIQPEGKIALPEKAIDYVDYLIVSVHSVFKLDVKSMTSRVLKAINYPKVKILGHPTGRLLGRREGYELEWPKIFEYCKKKNIALEINSWPKRLDLPDLLVREGLSYGLKFVIDTDAHVNNQMEGMFYGVSVARRGWCEKNDIMNTLPYLEFRKWLLENRN